MMTNQLTTAPEALTTAPEALSTTASEALSRRDSKVFQYMFYVELDYIEKNRRSILWKIESDYEDSLPQGDWHGQDFTEEQEAEFTKIALRFNALMRETNAKYDAQIGKFHEEFLLNKDQLYAIFLFDHPGYEEYFEACKALSAAKASQDEAYDKLNQALQDELSGIALAPGTKAALEANLEAATKATEEARLNTLPEEERAYVTLYNTLRDAQHAANLAGDRADYLAYLASRCSMEDEVKAFASAKTATEAEKVADKARETAEVLGLVFEKMYCMKEPEPEPELVLIQAIPSKRVPKFFPDETPPSDWSFNGIFRDAAKQGLNISIC